MHRVLFVTLITAALLIAPAASAETYTGLRLVGNGSYNGDLELMEDLGFYTAREFVVGFGEEIQGEVGFGFSNMSGECKCEDDEYPERFISEDKATYSCMTFSLAGFYPIMGEAGDDRVDVGLRFSYLNAKATYEDGSYDRADEEDEYGVSGWSIGPVARGQWRCCNDRIGFGPEVALKYGSYTMTQEGEYYGTPYEDDDSYLKGWNLEYSLRFDFFFDPK